MFGEEGGKVDFRDAAGMFEDDPALPGCVFKMGDDLLGGCTRETPKHGLDEYLSAEPSKETGEHRVSGRERTRGGLCSRLSLSARKITASGPGSVHVLSQRLLHGGAEPVWECLLQVKLHALAREGFADLEVLDQRETVTKLRVPAENTRCGQERYAGGIESGELLKCSEEGHRDVESVEFDEVPEAFDATGRGGFSQEILLDNHAAELPGAMNLGMLKYGKNLVEHHRSGHVPPGLAVGKTECRDRNGKTQGRGDHRKN